MKALVLHADGPAERLLLSDIARPVPGPDEVLVKVPAAGINPVDLMIAKGQCKPLLKLRLPATMGGDVAGVVVEAGSRVSRFKVGDAVFASTFGLDRGTLAEFVAVPEHALAHKPFKLDFVQAASMPMVGLTAWQALVERMDLQGGQKVFIPAGSGGIGSFAIQLARHLGATVGTTTSTANLDLVRGFGATEVIDYKKQAFEDVLHGYDAVLGTVRGEGLKKAMGIVRPGSTIVSLVGPPDGAFARSRGMNVVMQFVFGLLSRKIIGLAKKRQAHYGFLFVRPDGQQLANIGKLLERETIRPVIDTVFPFDDVKLALAYLEQGRAWGKVVVQMSDH
jgi:NADPH:quinone reductase-like Zn-dependent oxidoreductase